jgi:hypothetical protein
LTHVNRSRTPANMRNEARRWLHNARCADSHEDRAFVQRVEDAIQVERHFAEPTDVRANPSSALASGKLRWRIVGRRVVKWRSGASVAAALEKFAVHVDDANRPCLLVQIIHVLGAEEQTVFQPLLQLREGEVRRVGLCCCRDSTPHGIELPHQPGIATPRIRRGDFFDSVVAPETAHTPERRYPALGAYTSPSEDEDSISERDGEHGSVYAAR